MSRLVGAVLGAVLLAFGGCAAESEGTWAGTVTTVSQSGSPPATVADSYEVTVAVDHGATECRDCCTITTTLAGFPAQKAGGQHCDDDGFDVVYGGKSVPGIAVEGLTELEVSVVLGSPSRMNVAFLGGTSWTKRLAGEAARR